MRVLIGLSLLVLTVNCSAPVAECSAATCFGCCDASGQCQSGNATNACGAGGATCSTCSLGLVCLAGACTNGNGSGGGTTGGGTAMGGGTATGGGSATGGGAATGGGGGGSTTMAGTFTVSGHVTYDFVPATYVVAQDNGTLDFARASQKPVRNAVVRVVEGTAVLATTNTAADGAYSITFTSTGSGALTVQVLAKTSTPSITVQDNTSGYAVWAIGAAVPVGGGTLDVRATHGWNGSRYTAARLAGPFAILDSTYTAATAFSSARPALQFPPLKVNWSPNNTTDSNGTVEQGFLGTSYFDPPTNQIFVVGKDQVDTDEYDNHVIVHEWGHYFESNLSRSDSLGGNHSTGDRLDPRDSWSEGWGDAASAILLNAPIYSDTYWMGSSIDSFGWDLENIPTPTDDTDPGTFSEATVMRTLYDAWDPANEGSWDTLSIGTGTLADTLTGTFKTTSALTTLGAFAASLKAQSGVNAAAVDALLAHSSVGPITTAFGDGDPWLRAQYATVSALPFNTSVTLDGRVEYNFALQNKYWVVVGNGARITVSSNSAQDVGLEAYRAGTLVGSADALSTGGTETFSFNTTNGTIYVVTLTGYGTVMNTYSATMAITSP